VEHEAGRNFFARVALALSLGTTSTASAQDTLSRAKQTGKVTIGIFNGYPWAYVDNSGAVKGQAVDVLKAAFEPLGITQVEPVVTEFAALIPGLQSRRFDVIAAGLYITPERCKLVAFGNPDLKVGDGLLVLKGNPKKLVSYADIAQKKDIILASGRGSIQIASALKAGVPNDRMLLFPDLQAALSAMLAGRADAVTATTPSIIALAKSSDKTERALPFTGGVDAEGKPIFGYPGLAFRKADADFRDAYNAQLTELKSSGKLLEILKRYDFSENDVPGDDVTPDVLCK
jgi:polar amino acid transport system substrate-binding protein